MPKLLQMDMQLVLVQTHFSQDLPKFGFGKNGKYVCRKIYAKLFTLLSISSKLRFEDAKNWLDAICTI